MQIELTFIVVLILIQAIVFFVVKSKIKSLKNFFPSDINKIQVKKVFVSKEQIESPEHLTSYISELDGDNYQLFENSKDGESYELLIRTKSQRTNHSEFNNVITSTNFYLSRNQGSAADFNILKDICERNVDRIDNGIGNLINIPLYLGLAGTFAGIIYGLFNLKFEPSTVNQAISTISVESISGLINGVMLAMIASLFGLVFTVINSALFYKPAAYKNETDKNNYYDFIQRELLPSLSVGMAGSLNSFKSILNFFIQKFGENIHDYQDGARLLNENLKGQSEVLREINQLKIIQVSTKIAEIFKDLKDSSEGLTAYKEYQKELNKNISSSTTVVQELNSAISKYSEFNSNLNLISKQVASTFELQKQFKESLEVHFPTIPDHREVWRKAVDDFSQDVKGVYSGLQNHFNESAELIKKFTENNSGFFNAQTDIHSSIKVFVENSELQNKQQIELQKEIRELRNDLRESNKSSLDLNKDLLETLKKFVVQTAKIKQD